MHRFKPCLIWTMLQMNTSCKVVLKKMYFEAENTSRGVILYWTFTTCLVLYRSWTSFFVQTNCFTCLKYRQQLLVHPLPEKDNSYLHFLIQCIPFIICSQTKIILNKKMKIVTKVEISWHIFWIDSYLSYVFLRHQMHVAMKNLKLL